LIGPQTLYPKHRHPAIELYHVVAGTAAWTLDDVSRDNQPGTYILHPSQAVHAMQTRAQPLLAIYFWSGTDVRTASVYIDSSRAEETGQAKLDVSDRIPRLRVFDLKSLENKNL